ncbi:MAG: hypothetical protein KG003_03925 [Bacteroidetes bacterium]|nr:hypothetical protein [Bacteroidota bacterium]
MDINQKTLPVWIRPVSGIFSLMEIGVSVQLWFFPEMVLDNVDLHAKGVDLVVQMWAVRQFALGIIFAFATLKKSSPMLILAYVFSLVMFLGDLAVGFTQKDNTMIISALVMCVIATGMIWVLNKKK